MPCASAVPPQAWCATGSGPATCSRQPGRTPTCSTTAGGFEGGASVRSGGAFAAYALGFLAPGQPVQVLRSNRWTRLTAPGGHVLIR